MKRSEKPEGYRQMRPKTFPASNYTGSSRQMLQEIRESLRNLSKPSDAAKAEQNMGKMSAEDPRQVRNPPKFGMHHKALLEIRNSLQPFANETSRSPSEVNPQMLQDLQAAGFDERSEKPEGYRQMRPKTFPASNYTGSSRQMLQEIRESLRNLSKPSDAAKAEQNMGKMSAEDPRQVRNPPKFGMHHKALLEIRNSLQPFANETSRSPSEVNPQMLQDLQAAGFD
ncbi:LATS1, partial [Cervus elaphus hippelaphus]